MPINPILPATRREQAIRAGYRAEAFVYRRSPIIAAFLAGFLLGFLGG